ncbi:MAG TPA: alpha/beta hydrolase [Anaerolineales bacterium]|nr:alpha/beta hydrolase [Anaerolineales bacterium]
MFNVQPASYKTHFIDLPLSRLHVMETGKGEPLIMVPATISELENWRTLAQFMAQWFHVYFFELPGHGQSEPFEGKFSSKKVAELVGQLADKLGYENFNLMGFSFGGILAIRTFKLLSHRVDRMILIAPCLGRPALPFSSLRLSLLHKANQLLSHPKLREKFVDLIHDPHAISKVVRILQKVGQLEDNIPLQEKLPRTKASTVEVLTAQVNEILTTDFQTELGRYDTPCYFAMSVHDPLLRFETTKSILQDHFTNLSTVQLDYPFHQPPRPFTYKELNHDFNQTVDAFVQPKDTQGIHHVQQKVDYPAADRLSSDRNMDPSPAADRIPAMVQ